MILFNYLCTVILLLSLTGCSHGQLSISADAISESEVYVSWDTLGIQELQDFRLSFTTVQGEPWRLLSFFPGIRGFRVMDLDPGTLYYFRAQGQLGGEKVTAVTHVKTPPYADSRKPTNLKSVPVPGGVKMTWTASDDNDVLGYVLSFVEIDNDNVATAPVVVKSVFGNPELVLDELTKGARYKVQVQYRTRYGVGAKSPPFFIGEKLPVTPKFTKKPYTKKVVVGGTARLICGAVADPTPSVSWRRSGRRINTGKKRYSEMELAGTSTLTIYKVAPEDKGPYVCIVDNKVGKKVKAKAVLKVLSATPKGYPMMTSQPESGQFEEGQNITLVCSGTGRGKLRFNWYRDEMLLPEDIRYVIDNQGSLTIHKSKKSDAGDYVCEIENNAGAVSSEAADVDITERTMTHPPTFTKADSVYRVPYGGAINLTCEAEGDPAPSLKWHLENEETTTTARQGRFTLSLTNIQRSGSYQCVATSGEHMVTKNYEVIVELPALPEPIIHMAKRLDGGAGFVRWRLGDEETNYPGITGFTVTYTPVDAANRAIDAPGQSADHSPKDRKDLMPFLQGGFRYEVIVRAQGQAGNGPPSEPAYIPAVGQPEIVISPEPLVIPSGSSAIFHCRASGKPVPLLYWLKGSKRINYEDVRFKMTVKDGHTMLRIDNTNPEDTGTYTCTAANNILRLSVTKEATLEVLPEEELPQWFPQIVEGPNQMNVSGQQYLECVAGDQDDNITWYKDSFPVKDSPRILQEGGKLYFNSLSRTDEGQYQCRVTNDLGDVFSPNLAVTKRGPNRPSVKFVRVAPGSNVNLTCVGVGTPLPQVTWTYEGEEIENGGSHILQVVDIRESRNYTCLARTEKGEVPATFVILVQGKPRVAQGKPVIVTDTNRVEVRSGLGLNLTCSTGGIPVLYFKWLVDGELIFQDNRGENINSSILYLTNVRHDKNYTCVAVGANENAEVVFEVVVVGGENDPNKPVITVHPKDMYAFKNQPATIECAAEGDPPPIVTWYKDGKLVRTTREDPLSHKILLHGGKLFFLRVVHNKKQSDAGVYYCNATNAFGSTISDYATLLIAAIPEITTNAKPVKVRRGSNVTLTCSAIGPPEPMVTWRVRNKDLEKGESQVGTNTLFLRNVQRSDNYTCVAHNSVGRSQEIFQVWVGGKQGEEDNAVKVKEIKVVPGSFINLTCLSDNPRNTIYSWATEEEDLPVAGPILTLQNVRKAVNYTCTAETPDKTSQATFMVVLDAVHALVIGGTEFVEAGDPVSLTCNATGEYADVTDLEWFKNGVRLDDADHPEMNIVKVRLRDHDLLTSRLTIIRSRKRDSGVYACRADHNADLRSMDVLVFRARVTPHVKEVRIVEGEYMNLTCVTPGSQTNLYVWKKNKEYIKGHTSPFFSLDEVQESANYTCIAQGVSGVSKATFKVIVVGRQGVAISGPRSVEIGKTINVQCNATGRDAPPSDVVWLKDGEVLEESKLISVAILSGPDKLTLYSLLEVRNSTIDDSGTYVCQSSLGDSSSFKVKVKEVSTDKRQYGTRITVPPKNKNVEDGGSVRFYCEAEGPDTLQVHWEKAGRTVVNKGRFSVSGDETTSVLEIDPVILGEDDQVVCVANDGVGPTQSHFASINIYDHISVPFDFPAITEHPQLRAVEKGRTTVFRCEAMGTRNATIQWFKNKFPLVTGGRYTITSGDHRSQLEISGAAKDDEGVYQCSVENRVGITYSKLANLYVRGRHFPPQFTRPEENKRVRAGDDVTLVCTAVGSPMPSVRWYFNGRPINKVSRIKGRDVIRLKDVQESADYMCRAENLLGNIEYHSRVIVEDPEAVPVAPSKPVISNVRSRQATVSWEDSNKEGISPITVYIVHVRECRSEWHESMSRDVIVGGTSREVIVPGLKPNTCYQVRLTAKNLRGAGPDGEPSKRFFTRKEVSRAAPRNVKARLVMEDSGLISWTEPPATKDLAALQEYRVLYTITPNVPIQYWNNQSVPRDQTSAIIRALSQYATYTIQIQAVYNDGQRVESEPIELFVKDPARDDIKLTISNLEGEILSPSSVKLFWKNPVSVEPTEGYELYIEDNHDYHENIRVTGTANSYVLSGLVPGGEYIIRIARRTKYGEGPKTEPISIRLPTFVLEAPSIVDLSPINSSAILVNWKPPPLEQFPHPGGLIQGYMVTVDNQRRRENRRVSVGPSQRTAQIGGLTPDTRYSVRVIALMEQGDGPSSDPMFVTTNSRATQAPILEEVAAVNETALFIRWRPSPFASDIDVKGYFVYIEKVKAGPWDATVRYIMDVRPGTKYDIVMNNLTPGTKFRVEVAWYGDEGEGPRSEPMTGSTEGEITTTPVPDFLPRAPYLEEVSAMNATSLLITWWPPDEEVPGAEIKGYYVYIERLVGQAWNPESRYQTNIPPEGQLFIIGGLKPLNRYRVTVSAYSENGEGVKSEQLVVDTPGVDDNMAPIGSKRSGSISIPQAPSLNEVSAINSTSVLVKWRPARADTGPNAANIHGYYLYVEIYDEGKWRSEFKFETNALPAGQQLMINGLENNRKYRIRVSGFGPAGEGPQSAPIATETTANAIRGRTENRTPPPPRGFCQIYLGTICSRFLRNKSVFVSSRFAQSGTEDKVKAAVTYIANRLSQKCANLAMQTVCYTAFPPCSAVGNIPTPRAVCREDCYTMDTQCGDEMALIRSHPHVGETFLPHCSSLRTSMASSGGTCVRVSIGLVPGLELGVGQETRGERTQSLVPSSPQRMAVNPVSRSPYRVRVLWMPPQQPNGDITGYEVGWRTDVGDTFKKLLPANQNSYETDSLYRGLRYEFEVRALNPAGMSEPIRATLDIPEGIPGAPPLNFEANSNSTAIHLMWDPPPRTARNGRIIGYNLKAFLVSSPNTPQNFQATIPGLILQNVSPRTAYGFQIAAKTRAGAGPWSPKLIVTTT